MKTNPYINVGGTQILPKEDILGIFDLDTASTKTDTKRFLSKCESEGHLIMVGYDIPKSFVLTAEYGFNRVHLTSLNSYTLEKRLK